MSAIAIVRWRFGGDVHVTQLIVCRHGAPCSNITGVVRGAVQPRLVSGFAFARDRMEDPEFLSGANVKSHYIAFDVFLVRTRAALSQRWANDDDIARYDGRRTVADLAGGIGRDCQIQLLEEID